WPKGADCKSAGTAFEGSNPSPTTIYFEKLSPLTSFLAKANNEQYPVVGFPSGQREQIVNLPALPSKV
uniref:hypothetical protein n=1 Tax=Photobacterium leiognathi TaxID=553611 RepID=UPI0029818C3E